MKSLFRMAAVTLLLVAAAFTQTLPGVSGNPSTLARLDGDYYAPAFFWRGAVINGNSSAGTASISFAGSTGGIGGLQIPDGTTLPLGILANNLTPMIVDWGQAAAEYITPTSVSIGTCPAGNLGIGGAVSCVNVTAVFANTHGQNAVVVDGTYGAQTAANLAFQYGGGTVVVDNAWNQMVSSAPANAPASANAVLAALNPYASVAIVDKRFGNAQRWVPTPNATFAAVPATLTGTTAGIAVNGAAPVAGSYTNAAAYHVCIAYVDIMGNEGPCSADFSFTPASGSTNSIGFTAPAASAGMVGWVPYISLTAGTYALSYRVNMLTGGATGGQVCTFTAVETVINACKLTNSNYNQTGVGAIVSALTVNTARLAAQLGAASTTSDIVPNSAAHTVYTYTPGSNSPSLLPQASYPAFTITTAAATTVPAVLGTIQLPAGFMNFAGRTLRICGHASEAAAGSTATISNIQFVWDADGSNTTGAGVILGNGLVDVTTLVTANPDSWNFCGYLRTTVSGAGVTAGSIQSVGGWLAAQSGAAGTQASGAGGDTSVATTGSLNLAGEARIDVEYVHTTGTDANGVVLQNLTAEVVD